MFLPFEYFGLVWHAHNVWNGKISFMGAILTLSDRIIWEFCLAVFRACQTGKLVAIKGCYGNSFSVSKETSKRAEAAMIGGRLGPAVTLSQKMIPSICHKFFMSKHHCHGVLEEGGVFIERLFCVPRIAFSCRKIMAKNIIRRMIEWQPGLSEKQMSWKQRWPRLATPEERNSTIQSVQSNY